MSAKRLVILLFLGLLFAAYPVCAYDIKKVEAEGTIRTEKSVITKLFEGKPSITDEEIDANIKKLYDLKIFSNIEVFHDQATGVLRIKVTEYPIISDVKITGYDDISLEDIKAVVDAKKNELLDVSKLNKNAEKITDLYKSKGYLMSRIDYDIRKNEKNNEVEVVFKINEGGKSRVKKITIVGNVNLSEQYIKDRLNTQEDSIFYFFGDGGYKKELLEEDQARIMFMYNDEGYVNVRASKPLVTITPDKKNIYITFVVTEGDRYKVDEVTVSGDKLDSDKYPEYKFKLTSKDWYKHTSLIADIDTLKVQYGDEGHPFVTVIPERKLNDEKKTISVNYHIQKGAKCKVERIDITGNDRSKDKVIRREVRLYEGELYSLSAQKRSEALIKRTGFYDDVTINIKEGSAADLVKIIIKVKERRSGTFNVGAGFSSFESFVFNAKVDQNNFLGYGQTFSLSTQLSKIRKNIDFNVIEPYFLDRMMSLSFRAYYSNTNYDTGYSSYYSDYTQNNFGFNLTFGFPLNDYFTFYAGYNLDKVYIRGATKSQLEYPFRDLFTSSLEATIALDTRNDRMFATSGIYTYFMAELAHKYIGSDENILKLSYNFRFYQELFWNIVVKTNWLIGYSKNLDNGELPFSEQFRLGGIFSIRGYPYNSIGPSITIPDDGYDATSGQRAFVLGGDKKIVINTEIEIPIVKEMRLNLVGFLDVGNTWGANENYFYIDNKSANKYGLPLGMYWSTGFGLRWVTPIAPLSFEWGFPLTPRPGDPAYMFEFNIKNSF